MYEATILCRIVSYIYIELEGKRNMMHQKDVEESLLNFPIQKI